jgi:Flp pilus assembly protein TadB
MGYLLIWLQTAGRYGRWQRDVIMGVQDLVRILKLRMMAGEKVGTAMERTTPFLTGAIATEWQDTMVSIQSGTSVEMALKAFDQRIGDRTLTQVLTRLRSYHRIGVPDDPFGDLSDHLARVAMIQHEGRMKRLTAPLTMYALAGFVGVFLVTMLPSIVLQILQALRGSPLSF